MHETTATAPRPSHVPAHARGRFTDGDTYGWTCATCGDSTSYIPDVDTARKSARLHDAIYHA